MTLVHNGVLKHIQEERYTEIQQTTEGSSQNEPFTRHYQHAQQTSQLRQANKADQKFNQQPNKANIADQINNQDFNQTIHKVLPMYTPSGNSPPMYDEKNVPLELTSYGTTPSGKPRLFMCQVCTRAFARLEHLRRHERSHTKEKPFTCGVCQRKFSRRDLLLRHAQKLHAGCSDAIARLRRKSIKRANAARDTDDDMEEEDVDKEYRAPPMSRTRRGASFSAQSGANYASGQIPVSEYPDKVEFSTPQMMPSMMQDEPSWLNNLSSIPGMDGGKGKTYHKEKGYDREYTGLDYMAENYQFEFPTATVGANEMKMNEYSLDGYSFYDIPEMPAENVPKKQHRVLTPIVPEESHHVPTPQNGNYDLNFLNDMDELTHEIDAGSKFVPSGYFFYGDNPSVSSSGLDTNSPSVMSPAVNMGMLGYSDTSTRLFSAQMRSLIHKALEKYPISGIMAPSIPTNDRMELYAHTFVQVFLSHFPFIHPSLLNEAEMLRMTQDEDWSNESARVCLPLLVATIGALFANNKYDSEHLYEASRRTIHIYLESRKTLVNKGASNTVNPLWLIQSLTLSVIYGLFSENQNNVCIVIRQLNALNSLVKTSVKSQRPLLFSLCAQSEAEHMAYMAGNVTDPTSRFRAHINAQSQTRIVFMIYRLTNFLLMMYNVPLTLSVNDLASLGAPSASDEQVWSASSVAELPQGSLEELLKPRANQAPFRTMLHDLAHMSPHSQNKAVLRTLSQQSSFGFICLVHGLFEIQYKKEISFDVSALLDTITMFIPKERHSHPFEKVDFALLVNYTKISALVDLKFIKEQSWLHNAEQLTKNYAQYLEVSAYVDEHTYLRIVDCCIMTLKLVLLRTEDVEPESLKPDKDSSVATFEKLIGLRVNDEFDNSTNSIHSQMLFHVFAILSAFSVYVSHKNNRDTVQDAYLLFELNHRFSVVLKLLDKVEAFLKMRYQQQNKLDSFFNSMHLYNGSDSDNTYTLEKTLYILKVGEVVLNYMFDSNIKVSIFKKLSESLGQIRRYLIENEGKI